MSPQARLLARLSLASLASLALLPQGCSASEPAQPSSDGGVGPEIGNEAGDGRAALSDSGSGLDAGPALDAGSADGGPADAAAVCPASYAGCTTFTPGASGDQTLEYRNFAYDPKCLSVKAGTKVTFVGAPGAGSFLEHPLVQSCGPARVLDFRAGATTASFVLTTPGIYGYYCLDHGSPAGAAMSGAILVLP